MAYGFNDDKSKAIIDEVVDVTNKFTYNNGGYTSASLASLKAIKCGRTVTLWGQIKYDNALAGWETAYAGKLTPSDNSVTPYNNDAVLSSEHQQRYAIFYYALEFFLKNMSSNGAAQGSYYKFKASFTTKE